MKQRLLVRRDAPGLRDVGKAERELQPALPQRPGGALPQAASAAGAGGLQPAMQGGQLLRCHQLPDKKEAAEGAVHEQAVLPHAAKARRLPKPHLVKGGDVGIGLRLKPQKLRCALQGAGAARHGNPARAQ